MAFRPTLYDPVPVSIKPNFPNVIRLRRRMEFGGELSCFCLEKCPGTIPAKSILAFCRERFRTGQETLCPLLSSIYSSTRSVLLFPPSPGIRVNGKPGWRCVL